MKHLKKVTLILLGIAVLTGCGSKNNDVGRKSEKSSKPKEETRTKEKKKADSVVYEITSMPGITSTVTFTTDKDKTIQTAVTKTKVNISETGQAKEVFEENLEAGKNMYDDVAGVTHTATITKNEMTEELSIDVTKVPKESLPVLFATAAKEGKVSLEDYTTLLESAGYTKK